MLELPNPSAKAIISSFTDALDFFHSEKEKGADSHLFLFRGHSVEDWKITPSIFRQKPDIRRFEDKIIRELVSLFPHQFSQDESMFDRLVRMQHFDLPTRLLDASKNPLVALYFACHQNFEEDGAVLIFDSPDERTKFYDSDTVSCMANLANLSADEKKSIEETSATSIPELSKLHAVDRLVQFIRSEKSHFVPRIKKPDLFRPVGVIPKMSNARLNAQFGAFILFGLSESPGIKYSKNAFVSKVIIRAHAKRSILSQLESLGVSGSTLFPEIDKASKQIVEIYKDKAVFS